MIRRYIYRLNDWFNSRGEWTQLLLYFGFCIGFLALLGLSICYSHFNGQVTAIPVPVHVGKPSGSQFTDSLTQKKH